MSLEDFFQNLRIGQRLLERPSASTDAPSTSGSALATTIEQTDLWLTPRIVSGHNPDDLDFLTPNDRDAVNAAVRQFLDIARTVPPNQPATPDQARTARAYLETLVDIVDPQRFRDSQEWIAAALLDHFTEEARYTTPHLQAVRYEFDSTLDGSPLLVIYLILQNELANDRERLKTETMALWENVSDYLKAHGVPFRHILRFRFASEEATLHGVGMQ